MLSIGDFAPDFELKDDREQVVHLSDFIGKKVILYFYGEAGTPG